MAKKAQNTEKSIKPGGRPRIWDDPDELYAAIVEYFDGDESPKTVSGLALHLGFASRQSLHDYAKNEKFSYVAKRALLMCEREYEKRCHEPGAAGAMFVLSNLGWDNKYRVEQTGKDGGPMEVKITIVNPKKK